MTHLYLRFILFKRILKVWCSGVPGVRCPAKEWPGPGVLELVLLMHSGSYGCLRAVPRLWELQTHHAFPYSAMTSVEQPF